MKIYIPCSVARTNIALPYRAILEIHEGKYKTVASIINVRNHTARIDPSPLVQGDTGGVRPLVMLFRGYVYAIVTPPSLAYRLEQLLCHGK